MFGKPEPRTIKSNFTSGIQKYLNAGDTSILCWIPFESIKGLEILSGIHVENPTLVKIPILFDREQMELMKTGDSYITDLSLVCGLAYGYLHKAPKTDVSEELKICEIVLKRYMENEGCDSLASLLSGIEIYLTNLFSVDNDCPESEGTGLKLPNNMFFLNPDACRLV